MNQENEEARRQVEELRALGNQGDDSDSSELETNAKYDWMSDTTSYAEPILYKIEY